jgi:hypothetical protein
MSPLEPLCQLFNLILGRAAHAEHRTQDGQFVVVQFEDVREAQRLLDDFTRIILLAEVDIKNPQGVA